MGMSVVYKMCVETAFLWGGGFFFEGIILN